MGAFLVRYPKMKIEMLWLFGLFRSYRFKAPAYALLPLWLLMFAVNGLAVDFREQNVGNCAQHRFRRSFQQVGNPHQQSPLAQSNRIVHIGKTEEIDLQIGYRGPRA